MAFVLVSLEGSATGEVASSVGSTTVDGTVQLTGTFEIETGNPSMGGSGGVYGIWQGGSAFKSGGVWGIVQRIYIEGQTEGQSITVSLVLDNAVIVVGTVSLPVGVKQIMELGIQRTGWIVGVRLTATGISKRIEISSVEMDVYVSTPNPTS